MLLIPNATNDLMKTRFFYLHIQLISKDVYKKTHVWSMLYKTCVRMLIPQDCVNPKRAGLFWPISQPEGADSTPP